jgi:hypothetical protein
MQPSKKRLEKMLRKEINKVGFYKLYTVENYI